MQWPGVWKPPPALLSRCCIENPVKILSLRRGQVQGAGEKGFLQGEPWAFLEGWGEGRWTCLLREIESNCSHRMQRGRDQEGRCLGERGRALRERDHTAE